MTRVRAFAWGWVLGAVLIGCRPETSVETWLARRENALFGVWDCDRPRVAKRLLTAWAARTPPPDAVLAPHHDAAFLPSLLPDNNAVPGWEVVGKPVDADRYAIPAFLRRAPVEYDAYGVQRLVSAEYRFPRLGPWPQLYIEIYDMGTPENAFGIYSQKRIAGGLFRAIGAESYVGNTEVLGWADRYYFYVKSFHFADEPREAMLQFAQWIAHRIGATGEEPALIRAYADASLVTRSQKWFRTVEQAQLASQNDNLLLLPLSEKTRGFTVRVTTGEGRTAEGFCVVFPSQQESIAAFETMKQALGNSGYTIRPLHVGDDGFRATRAAP